MATQDSPSIRSRHPANENLEGLLSATIAELYQLLDKPLGLEAFYTELIARATEITGAANAAVWQASDSTSSALVAQTGVDQRTLFRSELTQQQHNQFIADVFADGRAKSVPLVAAAPEQQNHEMLTFVLHLQPVLVEGNVAATIQLVVRERPEGGFAREVSCFLTSLAAIATSFHHIQNLRHKRKETQWMTQFEEFVRAIHATLSPRDIAYAIANTGPALLECDRMFVLLRRGRKYRVAAVNGQSTINPRANSIRGAERLIKFLPQADAVVRYPDNAATFSPRDVEEFELYLDDTHAKSIVAGFFVAPPAAEADTGGRNEVACGCFIAEKYDGTLLPGPEISRARLLSQHCFQAIRNANAHHRIFLLPVWSSLGWLASSVRARLPASMLLSLLVAAGLLGSMFVPADFDLTAYGTLQPKHRQHVFARLDGTIEELFVKEGQQVARDELIARLSNTDLDLELEKVVGELRTTNEKLAAIKSSRLADGGRDRANRGVEAGELAAQEEELRQWISSLSRQQELIEQQRLNLLIRSPLTGQIITWNVDPSLLHRPVRRGQLLMTVADLNGPWELELQMPDRQAGHLLEARDRFDQPLEAVFILATNPNEKISGHVEKVATSVQLGERDGASLLVTVGFDRNAVKFVQPGATGMAKIKCGRRSIGYVWLHDLWDLLRYRIFFRI